MEILVKITTPQGEAKRTADRLTGLILPKKVKYICWTNTEDTQIFWEITGQVREILKINKNVAYFERIMSGAFDNPMVKRQVSKLSLADQLTLIDMLQHQTTLEVIKVSQMEEDYSQEKRGSWWAKVKEKFVRV